MISVTRVLARVVMPLVLVFGSSLLLIAATDGELEFHDVEAQTAEFMGYNEEIELTDEQDRVFKEALTPLPAPCCSDNSALTCCCPCNQARTWWGLTKHLIADRGYDAEQTRAKVVEWFDFTHPVGADGEACHKGRCSLPFKDGGCGGMRADDVNF